MTATRARAITDEAKERRREDILGAAKRVFAKKGFHATTIADVVERAVLVSNGDTVTVADFVRNAQAGATLGRPDALPDVGSMTINEMERAMILKSLQHHGGNVSKVADSLGLSRAALYRRFEKYGIEP